MGLRYLRMKKILLAQNGTLNRHAKQVTDELFLKWIKSFCVAEPTQMLDWTQPRARSLGFQ